MNRHSRLILFVICLFVVITGCTQETEVADLILTNATIYTVDADFSKAEALAVKDGKIIAVGTANEIETYKGENTDVIDAMGNVVLPGLIDAHAHLVGYATTLDQLNLAGTTSVEQIQEIVADRVAEVEPGVWITGRGWDQNDWDVKEFPTAEMLDAVAPDNPVLLRRIDGHAAWANSIAMIRAGLTADTENPDGGEIIHGTTGKPTGILVDNAIGIVSQHVPQMPEERIEELLTKAVRRLHMVGLTGTEEMGGDTQITDLMKKLINEGRFDLRLAFYYTADLENMEELISAEESVFGNHQLVIAGIKAFADGALGSRGAALLEPYSDRPETRGLIIDNEEKLAKLAGTALKHGKQIATHAIGDRANRIVLNAYEKALAQGDFKDHRLRIEHAQIIAPDDMPRFAKLGVIPSMQPTHCTSDFPWAFDRIGEERAKGAYAWRTLLEDGSFIPCGSDYPVEDINPFYGLFSAITRQHQDGSPADGYFPDQRMTREEALRGFTIWAARAAFLEDYIGSLEVGKYADFILVDRDIMTVDPLEIPGTEVIQTVVGGKTVHTQIK